MKTNKEKYAFFYLRTGGGHLAPAKSVAEYISERHPDIRTELYDGLARSRWFAKYILVEGYRILQARARWYYVFLYALNKIPFVARANSFLVQKNVEKYIRDIILNEKPTKIIITHFFLIEAVYKTLETYKLNIPVLTIVTDPYTAHPIWFLRKAQNFVVFSEELKSKLLEKKIADSHVKVFPFILNKKFNEQLTPEAIKQLKEKMNFKHEKTILVLGGGDGIPKGYSLIRHLIEAQIDADIAIVCGKNKALVKKLNRLAQRKGAKELKIFGYVDFVYELINLSDVVITKCGASTFMEILLSSKVPVIIDYLWEQEKGNVEYLVKNEMGIFQKDLREIPTVIKALLTDEELLKKYLSNIRKARLQNGTSQVAEYIMSFKP